MTADTAQFEVGAVATDDLDLVHASKNGDIAAFEQLVKRYDRKLLRIAQSVTHNREDSQDAVQEAFLKAYQHLAEFREDSQFSTWLIRITVNQSLTKLRKQRTARELYLDEDFRSDGDILPIEVADWAPNPEQLYFASELRNILIKSLKDLRPMLQTVFVLRDIEGLSIRQTAVVLNQSHTTVKARLWRARLQLREGLNQYFTKKTTSAPAQPVSSTGLLFGLVPECLDHTMSLSPPLVLPSHRMHRQLWRRPTIWNTDWAENPARIADGRLSQHAIRSNRSCRRHNGISI
jgi:RNA polymerase sigma-70 factor (ECF subfamily)